MMPSGVADANGKGLYEPKPRQHRAPDYRGKDLRIRWHNSLRSHDVRLSEPAEAALASSRRAALLRVGPATETSAAAGTQRSGRTMGDAVVERHRGKTSHHQDLARSGRLAAARPRRRARDSSNAKTCDGTEDDELTGWSVGAAWFRIRAAEKAGRTKATSP